MDWSAYHEAWNRHDGEAVASFFTDDGVYADQTLGLRHQGKEAIKDFVNTSEHNFSSDLHINQLDMFTTDDRYALVWDMTGTHDRSSQDSSMLATGKRFTIRGASIGLLEGGKIKQNTDYWNMVEFLAEVGLMPAPVPPSGRS
jgi:steroid delta-isomerase-like uncharacterized protein